MNKRFNNVLFYSTTCKDFFYNFWEQVKLRFFKLEIRDVHFNINYLSKKWSIIKNFIENSTLDTQIVIVYYDSRPESWISWRMWYLRQRRSLFICLLQAQIQLDYSLVQSWFNSFPCRNLQTRSYIVLKHLSKFPPSLTPRFELGPSLIGGSTLASN